MTTSRKPYKKQSIGKEKCRNSRLWGGDMRKRTGSDERNRTKIRDRGMSWNCRITPVLSVRRHAPEVERPVLSVVEGLTRSAQTAPPSPYPLPQMRKGFLDGSLLGLAFDVRGYHGIGHRAVLGQPTDEQFTVLFFEFIDPFVEFRHHGVIHESRLGQVQEDRFLFLE